MSAPDSVQSLNMLWEKIQGAETLDQKSRYAEVLLATLGATTDAERAEFFAGKRSEFYRIVTGQRSRSGAFEMIKAAQLQSVLVDMGLVIEDGETVLDARTGKRVKTRIRELARIGADWDSEAYREALAENWHNYVSMHLDDLKDWVRQRNANALGASQ